MFKSADSASNIPSLTHLLLLLANDVEVNPGPGQVDCEVLMEGLAQLAVDAPAGQVKHIILSWAPDKDVKADIDKQYRVPELKQALAWLRNCTVDDAAVKGKRKSELIDDILVSIERLLPDQCGRCQDVYSVSRLINPALQCGGCEQGIHEECLEAALGSSSLSELPGKVIWLCQHCSSRFSLVVGADSGEKSRSKRHTGEQEPAVAPPVVPQQAQQTALPSQQSLQQTGQLAQNFVAEQADDTANTSQPPPDCPLLLRNECPHGQSGKKDGQCRYTHRPRCNKYMKWGDKSVNGCKNIPCDKLHPLLCPRSLDLKCLEPVCDIKLHTRKCRRARPTQTGGKAGRIIISRSASNPAPQAGQGVVSSQGRPVYQPTHHRQSHHDGHVVQPPAGHPGVWSAMTGVPQPQVNSQPGAAAWPLQSQPVQVGPSGFAGQGWHSCWQDPTASGGAALPAPPAGLPPPSGPGNMKLGNFQPGCALTSPAVHQALETWASNMAREMARQAEITRGILFSSVKEMSNHLTNQGLVRPSF